MRLDTAKPPDSEDDHREHRNCDGHPAPLPGRPGRSQRRNADGHQGERIKRAAQPVVKLCPEAPLLRFHVGVGKVQVEEFDGAALAGLVGDHVTVRAELAEVDRVALEHDDGRVHDTCLLALNAALFQDQIGHAVDLDRLAALGDVGAGPFLVAPVLHEDAEKRLAGLFAVVERDSHVERGELALLARSW